MSKKSRSRRTNSQWTQQWLAWNSAQRGQTSQQDIGEIRLLDLIGSIDEADAEALTAVGLALGIPHNEMVLITNEIKRATTNKMLELGLLTDSKEDRTRVMLDEFSRLQTTTIFGGPAQWLHVLAHALLEQFSFNSPLELVDFLHMIDGKLKHAAARKSEKKKPNFLLKAANDLFRVFGPHMDCHPVLNEGEANVTVTELSLAIDLFGLTGGHEDACLYIRSAVLFGRAGVSPDAARTFAEAHERDRLHDANQLMMDGVSGDHLTRLLGATELVQALDYQGLVAMIELMQEAPDETDLLLIARAHRDELLVA